MDLVAIAPRIPVVGETIIGDQYFTEPGGKGANQAYAAGLLGGSVSMLGRIGEDAFGREMKENLKKANCNTDGIRAVKGVSGVALIFVAADGQNSIIVVPGVNNDFAPEHIEQDSAFLKGSLAVLLQLENPAPTVLAAAKAARTAGALVILDPAPAPQQALPAELVRLVDIMTPNETEAAILTGLAPRTLEPSEALRIGRKLQAMGAATVIVKLGSQGCVLVNKDKGKATLLPAPAVNAADTTAAGDVFGAGLGVALSEGLDLVAACRFANYAASLSVTRIGAQASVPTRKEVEEFAKRTPVGNPVDLAD